MGISELYIRIRDTGNPEFWEVDGDLGLGSGCGLWRVRGYSNLQIVNLGYTGRSPWKITST